MAVHAPQAAGDVGHLIPRSKLEAFDIETWGRQDLYALEPCRALTGDAWLTSCAWARYESGEPTTYGKREPDVEFLRRYLKDVAERGVYVVAWNAPFDVAFLIALGLRDEAFRVKWLDGLVLQRHLNNAPKFRPLGQLSMGLKEVTERRWPERAGYNEDITFNPTTQAEWDALVHYNREDTRNTLELTAEAIEAMTEAMLRNALIEARSIPLVADSIVSGIHMNRDAAATLGERLERDSISAFVTLRVMAPTPIGDDFDKVLASPKQLGELLYDQWGLPVLGYTDTGARSTNKEVLTELSVSHEIAKHVHAYREAKNNRTKFCEGTRKSLDYNGDGCSRPQAKIFGTYTGRVTYSSKTGKGAGQVDSGVALHQWKRDKDFRNIIEPPPGYTLIEADFAGQEYRWMAVESGDPTMLGLCAPGEDPHSYMGARCTGEDYFALRTMVQLENAAAKAKRQFGKVANLSCCLDSSPVLTDRGYVRIDEVRLTDKLWDGVEWVSHGGSVFQGVKEVITHDGITATPDHRVLVGGQWVRLDVASQHGWGIDRASAGFKETTCGEGSLDCDITRRVSPPETSERNASAMREFEQPVIQELRRTGDRVQVCVGERCCAVHTSAPAARDIPGPGHRPDRQQWTLRAGQPATGDASAEPAQQARLESQRRAVGLGGNFQPLCVEHDAVQATQWHNARADYRRSYGGGEQQAQGMAHDPGQLRTARTYDILDAGPRNRFVVNGRIVHNCQYRTSARTLVRVAATQHKLKLTPDEALNVWKTYRSTYPGVKNYWKRQIAMARQYGYVTTLAGRRVELGTPDTWVYSDDGDATWSHESTAINFPIQGIGADQKYLALLVLRDYLPRVNGRFYFELHDGLFVVVPDEHAERAAHEIKQLLSHLPYKKAWGVTLPIEFPVDVKRGKSWGSLKELK